MREKRKIPIKSIPKFAILVDGECEYYYIQMLKRNENVRHANIEPQIPQRKKLSELYQKVIELALHYDKVFWIIDLDVVIKESKEKKKGNRRPLDELKQYVETIAKNQRNATIIINNPCLEFWFMLHFEDTATYYDNCVKVIRKLKKHPLVSDYNKSCNYFTNKNNDIYKRLKPLLKTAIVHSKKAKAFDFKNPCMGLSEMAQLFEIPELKSILKQ